jgi:hypothetical protein
MSIEDKLGYLKDYMSMRIDLMIAREREAETFWRMFNEYGIVWATMLYKTPIPTFDYYINWIIKNEHN